MNLWATQKKWTLSEDSKKKDLKITYICEYIYIYVCVCHIYRTITCSNRVLIEKKCIKVKFEETKWVKLSEFMKEKTSEWKGAQTHSLLNRRDKD